MADTDGLSAEQIEGISRALDEGLTKQPLQTYEEMPDPAEQPEEKTFGSDDDGLRKAARELVNRDKSLNNVPEVPQESEAPITERGYIRNNGEQIDEKKTISPERAARDLTQNRNDEVAQAEASLRQLAAQEIDAVRAEQGHENAPDPVAEALRQHQAAQPIEPQPESVPYQQQPSGLDPEVAQALQNPKVRQALEAEVAQAVTARQQYAAAIEQTKDVAAHAVLAHFPELAGLSGHDQALTLKLMATQNPQRFQEAVGELQQVQTLHNQTLQFRQQEAQRQAVEYKSQWSNYVQTEDAKFEQAAPEMTDKETARKNGEIAIATLRNAGFADQDLKRAWNGEVSLSLRDHRAQLLILKAAKYDEAQRATAHPVRNVPQVQRPGVATLRGERDDDVRLADLSNRLERTGNARDAANLLIAKRARR
jgi:hypothetical protein